MNPYAVAAALLGAWLLASVPAALLLGRALRLRDQRDPRP